MHGSWILRAVALSAMVLALLPVRDVLAAEPAELRVFAAAGLTAACKELGPLFEKEHPGVAVVWNFAASGALLHQLEQGAPAEVFLSADRNHIKLAREKGLTLPDSDRMFAKDVVVSAVPAGNRAAVRSVQELFTAPVRQVGLGDPATTPLGSSVKEALQQEAWASLQPASSWSAMGFCCPDGAVFARDMPHEYGC
ncbi:molybdate ABC transporter substrate-binding protein [Megalodesulfovibrio paquesii]